MTNSLDVFRNYINEKVAVSETELDRIKTLSSAVTLRRKEHLLKEGETWKYRAFVNKGLLRTYRTDENGQEHTISFAVENWWVGDGESYISEKPTVYNIEALDPSEIICWKKQDFNMLMDEIPALKEMSELLMSRSLIASQNRIFLSNSQTAEDKYNNFISAFPEFAKRAPLHLVASYLGVTRETLSRIRRQFAQK